MNLHYSEIFDHRGNRYDAAMRAYPLGRAAEFTQLLARHPLKPGETVLEVPAAGGHMARELLPDVALTQLELSKGFSDLPVVAERGEWNIGAFDRVVCLAGLHHLNDQDAFVAKLAQHTKPGGMIHIADVDAATPMVDFLDGFVAGHNSTGHVGRYLSDQSFTRIAGTRCVASAVRPCPWSFPDDDALMDFAEGLFGLVDCPRSLPHETLEQIGLMRDGGGVRLDWRLRYIDLEVL